MDKWFANEHLKHTTPTLRLMFLSAGAFGLGLLLMLIEEGLNFARGFFKVPRHVDFASYIYVAFAIAIVFGFVAVIEKVTRSDTRNIRCMVIKKLCKAKYGNPLCLKDGQVAPKVKVEKKDSGFVIRVSCPSADFKKTANLENAINSCLTGKYAGFAVVAKEEDIAGLYVDYTIEDEISNTKRQSVYESLEDMKL